MIHLYPDTKIYVQCPAGACTGGAELLHQIVDYLRNKGKNAYIIYFGDRKKEIPSDYLKYNIEITDSIEDSPHNISVLYEPLFYQIFEKSSVQKVLWWLSVDNYFLCRTHVSTIDFIKFDFIKGVKFLIRRTSNLLFKKKNDFKVAVSIKAMAKQDVVCAYQSEYAHNFLHKHGFKEMVALKDYINQDHIKPICKKGREDVVLYNPKKGYEFTKQLIKIAPDIKWKPIINMSRTQVIEAMQGAKVYIDFGYHPGKDRLPRECAMNGLCVITGSRGSAGYFEDVWLENKYKFDESKADKRDIIKRIKETLINYDTAIDDFAFYRHRISLEKKEFEVQLDELFGLY